MNKTITTEKLYEAIKKSAEEINEANEEYGFYALRKVEHLNENSPIESLIRTADDLVLMAEKITS